VDISQQVEESDESNNQLTLPFTAPTQSPLCNPTPSNPVLRLEPGAILEGHTAPVWSVDYSPDGRLLISGSVDNTLRLWQVANHSLLRTMPGHPFPVLSVEVSPNNQLIATGSDDGIIRRLADQQCSLVHALKGHSIGSPAWRFHRMATALASRLVRLTRCVYGAFPTADPWR